MILGILYVLYVLVCLFLIFFVLIQQTRGGGLAGAFGGGGGSETMFGYTSMQKIGHYTIYLAVAFMVLSLIIANYPHETTIDTVVPLTEEAPQPMPGAMQEAAPQQEQPAAPEAAPGGETTAEMPPPEPVAPPATE